MYRLEVFDGGRAEFDKIPLIFGVRECQKKFKD